MPHPDDAENGHEPTPQEVRAMEGPLLLEFGASWCPYCQAMAPQIARMLRKFPQVRHIRIEDGPGRRLGRAYRVKLWPNLVFLRDGEVVCQFARPPASEVREGFEAITG